MATVSHNTADKTAARTAPKVPLLGSKAHRRNKVVGRLGPWQLLRLIGEGSLTRVYLAKPAESADSLAPSYAIKSLRKEWWTDSRAIESQRREAWVGQRVSHPNLLPVLSAGISAPPFYLVMPRLEGQTVETLLAKQKPALPTALWIARQAAEALAALHQATGMIHGDVKPSNLMVGSDGHTTLIDFGFCQTVDEGRAWADRPVVGTLHYMAPERLTSTTDVTPQSDLYSLGVMLYEMIAGSRPFDTENPASLINLHREARAEPLGSLRSDIPPTVPLLVDRLMAKDPLRRPESSQEVVDELRKLEIECFGLR